MRKKTSAQLLQFKRRQAQEKYAYRQAERQPLSNLRGARANEVYHGRLCVPLHLPLAALPCFCSCTVSVADSSTCRFTNYPPFANHHGSGELPFV